MLILALSLRSLHLISRFCRVTSHTSLIFFLPLFFFLSLWFIFSKKELYIFPGYTCSFRKNLKVTSVIRDIQLEERSDAKCVLFSFVYAGTKDSLFSENVVASVRKFSKKNTRFKTRRNLVSDDSFRKKVTCSWMDNPRFKTMLHHRQRFHLKWP